LRFGGGVVAVGWASYEAFQFGIALGADFASGDVIDARVKDAYFSFMNRALWVPYASSLADDRGAANEINVSRPKGLKDTAAVQIYRIEQEITGFVYDWSIHLIPSAVRDDLDSWRDDQERWGTHYIHQREFDRKIDTLGGGWIKRRLDEIDRINLDMNNWTTP